MKTSNTALLLIDVQRGFDHPCWGNRNNRNAEENIALLLDAWRRNSLPVVHVRHASQEPASPLRPECYGFDYMEEAEPLPSEKQFEKTVNSAFIGTGLELYLREKGITSIVVAGFTTDHCVSTSVRMAGNLGFDVIVVSDATATFDRAGYDGTRFTAEEIHRAHLTSLNGEFCRVDCTAGILESSGGN